MPSYGPCIYAVSDVLNVACPAADITQVSILHGVCTDENLPLIVIEAVVNVAKPTGASSVIVSLFEGDRATGVERQVWTVSNIDSVTGQAVDVAVRYLDTKPPSADITYSLAVQFSEAGADGSANVYGFTATTWPGGVTPLASND